MLPEPPKRPTRAELLAANGKSVPALITPGLRVLFCGINPGLYSAATRHHFARPGNRFWPVLHRAGFTPRVLEPWEERERLEEHTSELQSHSFISYAVFCLKKKKHA